MTNPQDAVRALLAAFNPQRPSWSPDRTKVTILSTESLASEFGVRVEIIDGAREAGCPCSTTDSGAPKFLLSEVLCWLHKQAKAEQ